MSLDVRFSSTSELLAHVVSMTWLERVGTTSPQVPTAPQVDLPAELTANLGVYSSSTNSGSKPTGQYYMIDSGEL